MLIQDLTGELRLKTCLTEEEVGRAVTELLDESIAAEVKADFLIALAVRGETPAELAAFVRALRSRSLALPTPERFAGREMLDVCGTGGDRLGTFNISTTVALVCSAAGVLVAKHGNRAVTSKSGSADVLEHLGVAIDLSPEAAANSLEEHGFAFLFAPRFHPAFRTLSAPRKLCAERGQRTMFNFIGPLMNPARPTVQLVGVSQLEWVEPMARVLQELGLRRVMVVAGEVEGEGFLDELSTLGHNSVAEFYQERGFHTSRWSPRDFPLQASSLAHLAGGGIPENAEIIRGLLNGTDQGPRRDAVLLNAAAAFFVAGAARSLVEGWELADETLASGKAARKLQALVGIRNP